MHIEGGLLSPDVVDSLPTMPGQKTGDFGLPARRSLVDEVSTIWADVRAYWDAFQRRMARAGGESLTTVTRESWVIPVLEALDYEVVFQRRGAKVDGRLYAISHRAGKGREAPPVHIVEYEQQLGTRPPAGRGTMSPHALVQDYLNRSELLWGIVTNGRTFRLLRDSSYFTRASYVEFDLEQMLADQRLDEFITFYRLVHRSRLPVRFKDAAECHLENYHQHGIEQGGRIRDGLRAAVERAILALGNGFLQHRKNDVLRQRVVAGKPDAKEFYRQLLYLIYRILFLTVAEERHLLSGETGSDSYEFYLRHLSLSRIRTLSETPLSAPERFDDLYFGLRALFYSLSDELLAGKLGLPALNGKLFRPLPDLDSAYLDNGTLLRVVAGLSHFTPPDEKVRRRVNYAALDVEELGSVYESLLDYQPVLDSAARGVPRFDFVAGMERKSTGSYYTRPELVNELIASALVPVIEARLKEAGASAEAQEQALLDLRVCDPACGSGHFLLAAARRLGRELARVRSGEEEPAPEAVREGVRDAITHCIYGVDKNPLAVDLCKVALWIEGHSRGKPLTFLDYRIRCGDSLVGVFDLDVLEQGIPDEAYAAVSGDEKKTARELRKRNKQEREGQLTLPWGGEAAPLDDVLAKTRVMLAMPENTPRQVNRKRAAFERLRGSKEWERLVTACNMWTAAYFCELSKANERHVPTTARLREYLQTGAGHGELLGKVAALAGDLRFFHWPLEFPEVFDRGGFDCVLCNPPWERIKLQEQEFFRTRDPAIARAPNRAERRALIARLPSANPELWEEYQVALHYSEALSKSLRGSGRFALTGRGDINTYSVFAETLRDLASPEGRAGLLVPTGIATDDTNKHFFADLIQSRTVASLYDFENREALFPGVHRSYKFCLLTLTGATPPRLATPGAVPRLAERGQARRGVAIRFAFFLHRPNQLRDDERVFSLAPEDLVRFNPNTKTCPIFRTRADAELTRKIYLRVPVLINEEADENPWGIRFHTMFHMSNASHLFRTRQQLEEEGYRLTGNRFVRKPADVYLPLYEAKMIWHYDHRFSTYGGAKKRKTAEMSKLTPEQHADPRYQVLPWYWVPQAEVEGRLAGKWKRRWLLGFRRIARSTDERTMISLACPGVGLGDTAPICTSKRATFWVVCLLGNFNSLCLDYAARQKIGGTHMDFFYVKQLPALPPSAYSDSDLGFIVPRVAELVYTSWDMAPFFLDLWNEAPGDLRDELVRQWGDGTAVTGGYREQPPEWMEEARDVAMPPFVWHEERRAVLRAELDAYYARLYGLTEEELRYILDPADVYGEDFPGETFRVLKKKEIKKYGEYRTRRLVLEAWGRL